MKVLSWNVRELGEISKWVLVRRDLARIRANWFALQEAKFCQVDIGLVNQIHGRVD